MESMEHSNEPTALITGGGGAIAAAIARKLDGLGYSLILSDLNVEKAKAVAATLSRPAEVIECDQTRPEDCARLVDFVRTKYPGLDVLVNNAGYIHPGEFLNTPAAEIDRHIEINLTSPLRLIQGIAPLMRKRGSGALVSIVSMGAIVALPDASLYSAGKFGLRGFLTALHGELKGTDVKVSGVYPVAVDTPMLEHEALNGGSVLNFINSVRTADEVADAVLLGIRTGRMEIYVPWSDGLTSRLAVVFPSLLVKLDPLLQRIGEWGRRRYVRSKGMNAAPRTNVTGAAS